ncbi:MAG: hypothetical protein RLZZ117_694 [Cyanobacteriota bacterium]|jgi:hypothetical protein
MQIDSDSTLCIPQPVMESSLSPSDALRRYEVIEKAYCEGRWATVVEAGTVLLSELPEKNHQEDIKGLRHRMHLLLAHTLLHGYGDRDAAEDLYLLVHNSDAESSLRQMAEDGLDQCHKPLSSTFVAEDMEDDDGPMERPSLFLPETEPEPPNDLRGPGEPAPNTPRIALHLGSPPVQSTESANNAKETPPPARPVPKEETPHPDLGLAADPFQPTNVQNRTETLHISVPAMPWTSPEEALAEPQEEVEPPAPTRPEEDDLATHLTLRPLIPEVVEEPELMEVHQANPALAEDVDLAYSPNIERSTVSALLNNEQVHRKDENDDNKEDLRSSLLLYKID